MAATHDGANDEMRGRASITALFAGFLKIGLLGFGGIAPWARHVIVEERRWLDDREFAEFLGVGQILPGPNTMNTSVMMGDRFQGPFGSLACLLGQMAAPLVIIIVLAECYQNFDSVPEVRAALSGAAAGAAGLIVGASLKMTRNIRPNPASLLITAIGFVTIGLLDLPMIPVAVGLVALGIASAAWERRNA